MRELVFLLSLSLAFPTHGADLVQPDPVVPEPIVESVPEPIPTTTDKDCDPRTASAPAPIPIAKIEGRVERVQPASTSSINWGGVFNAFKTVAIIGGVGALTYMGVRAYMKHRDREEERRAQTPYFPPVRPPVYGNYYGQPPAWRPYPYQGRPIYIRANPGYVQQPMMLGPAPAILPYPQTAAISYPVYPQTNYFGTATPIIYPTGNYSGVPTWML